MITRLILFLNLFLTLIFSACAPTEERSASNTPSPASVIPIETEHPISTPLIPERNIDFIGTNAMRYFPAEVDLTTATQIDIPLAGKPVWIAGIPFDNGNAWVAALEDGSLQAYLVNPGDYTQVKITPEQLPPGAPLTIYSQNGKLFALTVPGSDASPLTSPILLNTDIPEIAYIAANGDLVIWKNGQETRLPVNALPDSLMISNRNRLLFLSNPTDIYAHGVLGDTIEATGITLVQTHPEVSILNTISITAPDVIEGIYPIWTDINLDGELEIIVTLSNAQDGARIVAFHEDGSLLAEGPIIGIGYRWRHQLMVAPFEKSGKNLLAVVRTPHIGGVVEFYRLNGNALEIVAEIPGISTHSIGSRNLFTAQAGDFDNDGQVELLAPDQNHTRLTIVGIDGVNTSQLDLNAELVTNLATIVAPGSGMSSLAAGLSNNTLRVWIP